MSTHNHSATAAPGALSVSQVVRVPRAIDTVVVEMFERRGSTFAHLSLEEFYGQIVATHPNVRASLMPVDLCLVEPLESGANESSKR